MGIAGREGFWDRLGRVEGSLGLPGEGNQQTRVAAVEDELGMEIETGILGKRGGLPTERLRRAARVLADDERATPWITSHWSRPNPAWRSTSRWPW